MTKAHLSLSPGTVTFRPSVHDSQVQRGRYEEHYLKGWPEGEAYGLKHCEEHSETCAVRVTYISMAIVRQIIFDGGGPFLELG